VSSSSSSFLHLAVALDGAGWHPAAWRENDARPTELFAPGYWADLVREAESASLDFVTIEDSLSLQSSDRHGPDGRTDQVRGRLDAVLIAARVASVTTGIGLVPSVVVTHTEPFHISKAIATLDFAAKGRAGVRVHVSANPHEAAHFGRRAIEGESKTDLFDEVADYVEVLRRLWDSWEDDAEIRDVSTGRFIDREKLHYIDFHGRFFSVRGPSITPRPPQGQPVVTALAHGEPAFRFAARSGDVAFVTPSDAGHARRITGELREHHDGPPHVFGDLVVLLDDDEKTATTRKRRLDEWAGAPYTSDAAVFTGTAEVLAELLLDWREAGLPGFRLRPGALPHDLWQITRRLVPHLQRRKAFRTAYEATTLRGLLGLARPANRYAA
jgi:alkanesulfonate monooxygenase SsuD/methylene tetrahydromethanopterin reductase-like flavin-dependent oxidoreductase (luciferase family)